MKSELTPAELKFGIAPIPDSSVVTYQPDVIVVGGGPDAIRAQSSTGFSWTIDADAPRASELAPGKVFFMTNRAVGRVLDVRKEGGNLVVTVGPVDLVELVHDATISYHIPINMGDAIAYTIPGQSTQVSALLLSSTDGDAGSVARQVPFPGSTAWRLRPDAPGFMRTGAAQGVPLHFKLAPFVEDASIGLRATSQIPGLTLSATAALHVAAPYLDADVKVADGKVTKAVLELKGAAGLTMEFKAGTDVGMSANVNEMFQPDTDFSIPVYGLGPLPMAVTLRQVFIIKTGFGVKNTTLKATGDYTFQGSFRVGYENGQWGIAGPTGFQPKQSLLESMNGTSLAVSGLDMTDQVKVIVGVGVAGFAAGPYFALNSTVGVARTSDIQMLNCRQATLYVSLLGGVGYLIPKFVTDGINFILRQLNIKYRVNGQGGFSTDPKVIVNATNSAPASVACKGR